MMKKHAKLSDVDREFLKNLIRQGEMTAIACRRELALLELNLDYKPPTSATVLALDPPKLQVGLS